MPRDRYCTFWLVGHSAAGALVPRLRCSIHRGGGHWDVRELLRGRSPRVARPLPKAWRYVKQPLSLPREPQSLVARTPHFGPTREGPGIDATERRRLMGLVQANLDLRPTETPVLHTFLELYRLPPRYLGRTASF